MLEWRSIFARTSLRHVINDLTYYAATDGILATVASSILPAEVRTSGLALLGAAMALAAFAASEIGRAHV